MDFQRRLQRAEAQTVLQMGGQQVLRTQEISQPASGKPLGGAVDYMLSFWKSLLTTIGVCGTRIAWIHWVFPGSRTFQTIMTAYPISLATTMMLIVIAAVCYRPSKRYGSMERGKDVPGAG